MSRVPRIAAFAAVPFLLAGTVFLTHVKPEAEVRRALQHYLDGHATGRADVARPAFHEAANLYFVRDGEFATITVEQYLSRFSGHPAEDESERRRRIVSVDVSGTAAVARIELDYPGAVFTDYMALLKVGDEWKIVSKVFHREVK